MSLMKTFLWCAAIPQTIISLFMGKRYDIELMKLKLSRFHEMQGLMDKLDYLEVAVLRREHKVVFKAAHEKRTKTRRA